MARIPAELKSRIRGSLSLAEVVMADGFTLHSYGRGEWRGDCPFHPSASAPGRRHTKFHVKDDHFRCYDCREQGDVFEWFRKQHGLEFMDAIREAADRAGIDIEPYLRSRSHAEGPAARRAEALAAFYDLTVRAGRGRDLASEEDAYRPLLEAGEMGWLEDPAAAISALRSRGVADECIRDIGLNEDGPGGAWLLWAVRRGSPIAARPLGMHAPIIGIDTAAWVHAPKARRALAREGEVVLVVDDHLYVQLRAAGRDAVFLPVSRGSLSQGAVHLPRLRSLTTPPVLLTRPLPVERKAAFDAALELLPVSPRLRVGEIDLLPSCVSSPDYFREAMARMCQRAGTVVDWQLGLANAHRSLADDDNRRRVAQRLDRIVAATTSPLERRVYEHAISMMGISREDAVRAKRSARA